VSNFLEFEKDFADVFRYYWIRANALPTRPTRRFFGRNFGRTVENRLPKTGKSWYRVRNWNGAPERVGFRFASKVGATKEERWLRDFGMEEQATAPAANEIEQIWFDYKSDPSNYELRNALIERYMPIVRRRAERIRAKLPNEIELDDLISAGSFGLIDAVSAYDPGRGVKFETFCIPRVQGSMLDELRSLDWAPRMVRSKATKLNEAYKVLEGKYGRRPSEEELAEFLEQPLDEVRKTIVDSHRVNVASLDKKWQDQSGDNDVTEMDVIPDKRGEDPTERLERAELIRVCTKGLSKSERLIIILYYFEELTMKEIGATLDLSESRVSQMHSAIVQRMKKLNYHRRYEL
jgi:RNA polymerase sigma factor for flagellar operon FliA